MEAILKELKKVKQIYWSEKIGRPVFELEDGRIFYPYYLIDGAINWKEIK